MRRILRTILLAAIAGAIIGWFTPAEADHNGPVLPFEPTIVVQRVMQKGYVTYRLDQGTAAYPNFRTQATMIAEDGLANLGIPAYEITEGTPDIWLTMPDDQTFINMCGSGAAGCITYTLDPVVIYFRRALLYSDWRTTIAHEGINYGHAMGEHEEYDDRNFRCLTDRTWTVMSCGTATWMAQPFDIAVVRSVTMPSLFNGGSLFGSTAFYGGSDSKTTRIAVFYETYAGFLFFSGHYLPPVVGCTAFVCGATGLGDLGKCTGVWLGRENALPGSFLRELQPIGWTSCF